MTTELDRNIERLVNADHNTKNRSSVNGMNDRDSFDFFYGDTTIERLIVAYTRQQLGDIAYNAVTTLVDPIDLYRWRAQPSRATIDLINSLHCEHKSADVLADDGQHVTLRCTWGCGRLIEEVRAL